MPPLPYVPGVIRALTQYQVGSDLNVTNKMYFSYSGSAPDAATLNTWGGDWLEPWVDNLQSLMSHNYLVEQVVLQDIGSSTGKFGTGNLTSNGSRGDTNLPAEVCCLVNHHLDRHYRGGKPRSYTPFGIDTDLDTPQSWAGSFVTGVTEGWNAFVAAVIAAAPGALGTVEYVSVSYWQGSTSESVGTPPYVRGKTKLTPKPGGPTTDLITTSQASTRVASQRRRSGKH